MRIAIVTDAWHPQTSGVVTTFSKIVELLRERNHEVVVIHPGLFRTVPCPTYPEMRLALSPSGKLARLICEFRPEAIHLPIEGPLGIAGRRFCLRRGLRFTTSVTTKWPEYLHYRFRLPKGITYGIMRWFHSRSSCVMVSTPSFKRELERHGFSNISFWSRGVDTELFRPRRRNALDAPGPINLYLGRVAVEKNIGAFLDLDIPGTKVVIGDGPALAELKAKYTDVIFTGRKTGEDLARHVAAADVFVFPSLTDTFGIVMIEAMACGVPVAAFPAVGPLDVVAHGETGWLDNDLKTAVEKALGMSRRRCRPRGSLPAPEDSGGEERFGRPRHRTESDVFVHVVGAGALRAEKHRRNPKLPLAYEGVAGPFARGDRGGFCQNGGGRVGKAPHKGVPGGKFMADERGPDNRLPFRREPLEEGVPAAEGVEGPLDFADHRLDVLVRKELEIDLHLRLERRAPRHVRVKAVGLDSEDLDRHRVREIPVGPAAVDLAAALSPIVDPTEKPADRDRGTYDLLLREIRGRVAGAGDYVEKETPARRAHDVEATAFGDDAGVGGDALEACGERAAAAAPLRAREGRRNARRDRSSCPRRRGRKAVRRGLRRRRGRRAICRGPAPYRCAR
jgi:glycosyltransferase involved in cell wall biosynthesis